MSTKLKLTTILGTRPEIIRLSEVIRLCDQHFHHTLVHTGQNWNSELSDVFFNELDLKKPDVQLAVAGENVGTTIGNIISRSYEHLRKNRPDALLILGDTNSGLSALSAKRLKIPIFHMEAGNRCFDENVPEEINRRIIDHISDINLPYTEHSRRYLINEGLRQNFVFVTGSPMPEVLHRHYDNIQKSKILDQLNLRSGQYLLISAHREENLDISEHFGELIKTLNEVATTFKLPIIYSTHPRTQKRIDAEKIEMHPLVSNFKPFGFFDYNQLQMNAFCTLSDSGTLSEEASILNFPAVLLRTSTERPEALDKGGVIISGLNAHNVIQSINMSIATIKNPRSLPADYTDENVSDKIVKIIQSYTSIVNDQVWRKLKS